MSEPLDSIFVPKRADLVRSISGGSTRRSSHRLFLHRAPPICIPLCTNMSTLSSLSCTCSISVYIYRPRRPPGGGKRGGIGGICKRFYREAVKVLCAVQGTRMMGCWAPNSEMEDEFEKLVIRMNPPRVTVDNRSDLEATLVKVDSANKFGSLLEVVQALTDMKLTIRRAYITSDGEWFMDVFHVVDEEGNKVDEGPVIQRIEQSLARQAAAAPERAVGVHRDEEKTTIELVGMDRPGLLSEVFAVLAEQKCNVVSSEVWTHGVRVAALLHVTDADSGDAVDGDDRLDRIKRLLRYILRGSGSGSGSGARDKRAARTAISAAGAVGHAPRRLHQMMHADQHDAETEEDEDSGGAAKPAVAVENCVEKGYTLVKVRCRDRAKLLFDTVCTLTDMRYVVFHGTVIAEGGGEAYQEYYVRHLDRASAVSSGEQQEQLARWLQAAIQRRTTEGLRLELCCEDRVGLLADVTRIFREHGMSVTHAEVATRGAVATDVFYVVDASGEAVTARTVEDVRRVIGKQALRVGVAAGSSSKAAASPERGGIGIGRLLRTRSEKLLFNLQGLIKYNCS